jgi:hypothetical protein
VDQLNQSIQILRRDLVAISKFSKDKAQHILLPRSVDQNSRRNDSGSQRKARPKQQYPYKHLRRGERAVDTRVLSCHHDKATRVSQVNKSGRRGGLHFSRLQPRPWPRLVLPTRDEMPDRLLDIGRAS